MCKRPILSQIYHKVIVSLTSLHLQPVVVLALSNKQTLVHTLLGWLYTCAVSWFLYKMCRWATIVAVHREFQLCEQQGRQQHTRAASALPANALSEFQSSTPKITSSSTATRTSRSSWLGGRPAKNPEANSVFRIASLMVVPGHRCGEAIQGGLQQQLQQLQLRRAHQHRCLWGGAQRRRDCQQLKNKPGVVNCFWWQQWSGILGSDLGIYANNFKSCY